MKKTIDLGNFKRPKSTLFTGRPQGKEVRNKLKLDTLDSDPNIEKIIIVIPENITSINSSFYLGLLYDSFKNLGKKGFESKYEFNLKSENKKMREVIRNNLDDAKRYAMNQLNNKSNLWNFIK